jgi:TPR repeat protein
MTTRPGGLALLLVLLAATGCTKGDQGAIPSDKDYAAASVPPMQIANAMGACEDLAVCERECDAGSGDRCRRLGVSYEFGQGVPKDVKQSIALYERSCDLGNATGCEAAGRMYEFHAEPKDLTKAASFLKRACDIGWQSGCANYALLLEQGRGVPRDVARAKQLYEGACKAGAGLACDRLKILAASDGG